jgi:hypothetical protein
MNCKGPRRVQTKVLERVGAIRLPQVRDPVTPENVESALDVFQFRQDGMEAVSEDVRFEELRTAGRVQQQARALANKLLEHRREIHAKVNFAGAVLCFEVGRNQAAPSLLRTASDSAPLRYR